MQQFKVLVFWQFTAVCLIQGGRGLKKIHTLQFSVSALDDMKPDIAGTLLYNANKKGHLLRTESLKLDGIKEAYNFADQSKLSFTEIEALQLPNPNVTDFMLSA